MTKIDEFLNKTNLEDKVLEAAARGDSCNTAHWLREYKDIIKVIYSDIYYMKEGKKKANMRILYGNDVQQYLTFKSEMEDILGERLQL